MAFLSFWSYFSISIGGLHAKYDQLFIVLIFCLVVSYKLVVDRRIYIDAPGFFLIFLCFISFFSSYFNAPDPAYSLRQTVNLFSVSLAYFVFPIVLSSHNDISDFVRVFLRIAKAWLIAWIFLFLFSYTSSTPMFGVTLDQTEHIAFGVYATMIEPNIFGSFMLVIFFFSFSLYVSESGLRGMTNSELRSIVVLSLIGIFVSFTRGVWLATIIGLGVHYIFNSKNVVKTLKQIALFSVGALLLLYVASEVLEIGFVKYKITNFFSSQRGTGSTRLEFWGMALNNWIKEGHAFLGTGTFSFASFLNTTGVYSQDDNAWISNLYLAFLHDTGLVGLLTFLFFLGLLTGSTQKARFYKDLRDFSFIRDFSFGLFLTLLAICIAFFFTTGLTTSYPWILFGVVSAFNRANRLSLRESMVRDYNPR